MNDFFKVSGIVIWALLLAGAVGSLMLRFGWIS
jgi:hypothetical protein